MASIREIVPDAFLISIYVADMDMQFNCVLAHDNALLLFHANLKAMYSELREAVATPDATQCPHHRVRFQTILKNHGRR